MNTKQAFQHIKKMSGSEIRSTELSYPDPLSFATELNKFYCRFDKTDCTTECTSLLSSYSTTGTLEVKITQEDVAKQLSRTKPNKAPGPDGIPGRLLKECAAELGPALQPIFQQSIDVGEVPTSWKTSTVVPVPKKSSPTELNHFRPVALTSLIMKCFEKMILNYLLFLVSPLLDPLQFAYQAKRGTDDAVSCLLHRLLEHLDTAGNYARILFVDFSSAFNTIQRHIMIQKLQNLDVPIVLTRWLFDFLSNRPQCVRVGDQLSPTMVTNTGAPQGCVLSPFLFILYTNDCRSLDPSTQYYKFSDDAAILALLNDQNSFASYQQSVAHFSDWCTSNFLELNVSKTKEMVVDFRRNGSSDGNTVINDEAVSIVESFRYLGVVLDNKLTFSQHTSEIQKKCQRRLYVLRRLRSFSLDSKLLLLLYRSIIESLLTYCSVCFFPMLSVVNRNKLLKVSQQAAKIIGRSVPQLSELTEGAVVRKALSVAADTNHPLNYCFELLPSGRRYRCAKCNTARLRKSFIPQAVVLLNK